MRDDFDNDDLSWQRKRADDDQPQDDDFPDLDWLSDGDTDQPVADPKRSGVTGELPWLSDQPDTPDAPAKQDDAPFNWQSDDEAHTPATPSGRLGVTGELSWLQDPDDPNADAPKAPASGLTGQLDWRKADFADQLAAAEEAAGVNWDDVKPTQPAAEVPADATDDDDAILPSWLDGMDDDDASDDDDDLDAWLFADDTDTDETTLTDDAPVQSWLTRFTDSAPPADNPADAFDFTTFETDDSASDDDDAGSLSFGFGDSPSSAYDDDESDSDALPSWLLGADDEDENEQDHVSVPANWTDSLGLGNQASFDADEEEFDDNLDDLFGENLLGDNFGASATQAPATPSDEYDFFAELTGADSTGLTGLLNPDVGASLDLDALDLADSNAEADAFFSEFLAAQAPTETPPAGIASQSTQLDDDEDSLDWLADLEPEALPASKPISPTETAELDDFIASLGDLGDDTFSFDDASISALSTSDDLEFDDLFADPAFDQLTEDAPNPDELDTVVEERPDWLANVAISDVSAAAIVRKGKDRPLESLSDRLQAIHEVGMSLPTPPPADADPALAELLPDAADALPPARIEIGSAGLIEQMALTPAQAQKVTLLNNLTSRAVTPDAVIETKRTRFKLDRLLIVALITAAVLLPFFGFGKIGDLPPTRFTQDTPQQAAFAQVDRLRAGQLVLVAVEYGATAAGELDAMTNALLHHVFLKGARPVLISSDAIGSLRGDALITTLAADQYERNTDYYVGRYLAGAHVGLRGFSQTVAAHTKTDIQGVATGLTLSSLDDFALIIVISENVEGVRLWAEQAAPLTRTPFIYATSISASPLTLPYAQSSGNSALLVGYRDAYTYAAIIDALHNGEPVEALDPNAQPSATPTLEPTTEPTSPPTQASTAETDITQTEAPAQGIETTITAQATEETDEAETSDVTTQATSEPVTPQITSTTPPPTRAPATTVAPATTLAPATITPTQEPAMGIVIAQQAVNVRGGAGRDFAIVGALQPNARVEILGKNADSTWYNIRFAAANNADTPIEGWVLSDLIEIEPPARAALPTDGFVRVRYNIGVGAALLQSSDDPAATTETSNDEPEAVPPPLIPHRDERWYAMTLGTLAIIIIIIMGNGLSLLRRAAARRKQV